MPKRDSGGISVALRRDVNTPKAGSVIASAATAAEDEAALSRFEKWMRSSGISWDATVMELRGGALGCAGAAWGVFARSPTTHNLLASELQSTAPTAGVVRAGHVLCRIPLSAVLSVKNSKLGRLLMQERLGGGLALVAAVMHEASLAEKSRWHGYLASLPTREYVPVFWSAAELQELQGTELEGRAEEDRWPCVPGCQGLFRDDRRWVWPLPSSKEAENMRQDLDMLVADLVDKYPERVHREYWTLDNFMAAASWVSSRAFYVDSDHGQSLVPLADVFNHKAAVVSLLGDFQIAELDQQNEGEDDGEDDEGEEGEGFEESSSCSSEGADEGGAVDCEQLQGEEVGGTAGAPCNGSRRGDPGCAPSDGPSHMQGGDRCSSHHVHHHTGCGHSAPTRGGSAGSRPSTSQGTEPACTAVPAAAAAAAAQRQRAAAEITAPPVFKAGAVAAGTGSGGSRTWPGVQSEAVFKDGVNLQMEIAICIDDDGGDGALLVVAACDTPAGAEIHNTYGELANPELLHRYGFVLRHNPFTEVRLAKEDVLAAAQGVVGKRALRQRRRFLEKHSDLLSEDEEPFLVLPGGRINTSLFAALCVLAAADAATDRWTSVQQAIDEATGDVPAPPASRAQAKKDTILAAANAHGATTTNAITSTAKNGSKASAGGSRECAVGGADRALAPSNTRPAKKQRGKDGITATVPAASNAKAGGADALGPSPLATRSKLVRPADAEDAGPKGGAPVDQQATAESEDEVAITPGLSGWSVGLLATLRHAVVARAARYPVSLAKDRQCLVELEATGGRSEQAAAERAAVALRVTEQEVLACALEAIS